MEVRSSNRGFVALLILAALVLGIIGFLLLVNPDEDSLASGDGVGLVQSTEESGAVLETEAESELPTEEIITDSKTPTKTSEKIKPTARVGLQGTDPETVNLASGDIQLVEFFAFW